MFTRSDADYAVYAAKRNQVKSKITSAKAQFDNVLLQNLTTNPKALYGYVRQKSKLRVLAQFFSKHVWRPSGPGALFGFNEDIYIVCHVLPPW